MAADALTRPSGDGAEQAGGGSTAAGVTRRQNPEQQPARRVELAGADGT
jgi:hypothetical protein